MSERLCEFEGCGRKHAAKGYCGGHWQQLNKGQELRPLRVPGPKSCSFDGCTRPFKTNDLCGTHAEQKRLGRELTPIPAKKRTMVPRELTFEERLWTRVEKAEGDGCWMWTGHTDSQGYGSFGYDYVTYYAHRVAYELEIGPIPEGMQIDHLCKVEGCVRPSHLRAVDASTNVHNRTVAVAASGYRNVYMNEGRWRADLRDRDKRIHLGYFATPELANEAVIAYRKEHGIIIDSRTELLGLDSSKF